MGSLTFKTLFSEHADFVWRALRRHGVPERELDDARQEVFIVVFRRLSTFEGRSSMRSWMYGIAVRVAMSMRRRAFFRRELLNVPQPEEHATHDMFETYAQKQALERLKVALSSLRHAQREVFVLYELEGMTIAETAAAMGVPENTALYRLYAARRALSSRLQRTTRPPLSAAGADPRFSLA